MKALALLLALSLPAWATVPRYQTEWTLYRSPVVPLAGGPSGQWHKAGTAWSASTVQVYSHLPLAIESCRVAYSLNPNTGASPTGFRVLAHTAIGNHPIATILRSNAQAPVSGGVDVTQQMQWLLTTKGGSTLSLETVGNGSAGPLVYHVVIECIWGGA
jgi:hypothetical protein